MHGRPPPPEFLWISSNVRTYSIYHMIVPYYRLYAWSQTNSAPLPMDNRTNPQIISRRMSATQCEIILFEEHRPLNDYATKRFKEKQISSGDMTDFIVTK